MLLIKVTGAICALSGVEQPPPGGNSTPPAPPGPLTLLPRAELSAPTAQHTGNSALEWYCLCLSRGVPVSRAGKGCAIALRQPKAAVMCFASDTHQSVWWHLWKAEQSPAAALPRVTTLSPILATSALLCPEHNPFTCPERHRKWDCAQWDSMDGFHPSFPSDCTGWKHSQAKKHRRNFFLKTHSTHFAPQGSPSCSREGVWGVEGLEE